ncbi:SMC-Scp complex subunit ScpB [Longispora sp. NPDC051575]|uniref:SMC-Scp complex subunit ScpB n=1 Tax=Longispora sp. NPDC051575 TaxID=3154943 RepID=UPI0034373FBE
MTTPAEREFAEGVAAWTPPWAREPEPEAPEDTSQDGAPEGAHPTTGADGAEQPGTRVEPADAGPGFEPDAGDLDGLDDGPEGASVTEADPEFTTLDPVELRPALEAILLVIDEPVAEIVLAQVLEQPTQLITDTLVELAASYAAERRGFELRRAAGGWRLYTRADFAPYVEKFVLDGQQTKLTQAALETLAVVAYKQPVTRGRISAIRGVNCDGVLRTLLTRGLVEECGSEPDSGAYLYRTTTLFLEKLGINSPEDLPSLAPYLPDDIEALADAHDQS